MPHIQLTTHEQFEDLWLARKPEIPIFLIWFVSGWGTPSQRIDKTSIEAAAYIAGVPLYVCDIDHNTETSRFCKVWAASTFLLCAPKKQLAQITSSDIYRVSSWITAEVANAKTNLRLVKPPIIRSTQISITKPIVAIHKTI